MHPDSTPGAGHAHSHGPGPFITHRICRHRDGGLLVANSRRHRKGLQPHRAGDHAAASAPQPSRPRAFAHFWAPQRLAWWVAILFAIGASLFSLGGIAACWPEAFSGLLAKPHNQAWVFVTGAIFFTSAAWLQWLEALNGDVAEALTDSGANRWCWYGWRPRNLGYLASAVQLVGTIMFNFNTVDGLLPDLSWQQQDLLIWTPNMLGCLCFLAASALACLEVTQGTVWLAPTSISWWISIINLLGSIAFQLSALYSLAGPEAATAETLFKANFLTAAGGVCFLLGAYLMIPELFDEELADAGTKLQRHDSQAHNR